MGIGGSMTIQAMGLSERLAKHNEVIWHWEGGELRRAMLADVYLTSVNGLAETGEIVNIDGNCNRVAAPCLDPSGCTMWWASTKSPLILKRPCGGHGMWLPPRMRSGWGKRRPAPSRRTAATTVRVPSASAGGLSVLWRKPTGFEQAEVVLIEEELGM